MSDKKFFGKYRGTVLNNIDPMMMGRIQAIVPDVTGLIPSSWCMPCFQVAGIQNGVFTVPIVGSAVWIEYEHGDPDYPDLDGLFLRDCSGSAGGGADRSARCAGDHLADAAAKQSDD